MPSSHYCPPPQLDVISTEHTDRLNGKKRGNPIHRVAEGLVALVPDKHGDVNSEESLLRNNGVGKVLSPSHGLQGECQALAGKRMLDNNGKKEEHASSGQLTGAMNGYEEGGGAEGADEWRESLCEALEKRHVHDVYEDTAHHFTHTRYKPWPRVKHFLENLPTGAIVADIGCGHGKYLEVNPCVYKLGSDRSAQLMRIAAKHRHEVMVCDNLKLPYRTGCFDAVISVGVIHHFTSPQRRLQAVTELARVLRPGGQLIIYVWALEQKHRKFGAQDVLVPWHLKQKTIRKGKQLQPNHIHHSVNGENNDPIQESSCIHNDPVKNSCSKPQNSGFSYENQTTKFTNSGINIPCKSVGVDLHSATCEANPCQNGSLSKPHHHHQSKELIPSSAMSESYQEQKSKDTVIDTLHKKSVRRPQNISNQDFISENSHSSHYIEHTQNWVKTETYCTHPQPTTNGPRVYSETVLLSKSRDNKSLLTPDENTSFGAAIRKKLSGFFSFGNKDNKAEKQRVCETVVTHHIPLPLFSRCCAAPILCSGFAVREFPQSSRPDRCIQSSPDDDCKVTDELSWKHVSECDSSSSRHREVEVVSPSQMTPKYASIVDSLRLQVMMSCAAEQQSKHLQSCSDLVDISQSLPGRAKTNHKNMDMCSEVSSVSNQKQEQHLLQTNQQPGETSNKSNSRGKQSNYMTKLNSCDNQLVINGTTEDLVKFSLGEEDSQWLTTTGEAIQRMELAVLTDKSVKDYPKTYSSGPKHTGCGTILPGKISSPRLQRLSQSSSVSSFSSENYSDSEVEETGILSQGGGGGLGEKHGMGGESQLGHVTQEGGRGINKDEDNGLSEGLKTRIHPSPRVMRKNGEEKECSSMMDKCRDTYKRYYHVFKENELDDLMIKNLKNLKIVQSAYDHANWYIIAEKLNG